MDNQAEPVRVRVRVSHRMSDDTYRVVTDDTTEVLKLSRAEALRVATDILELAEIPYGEKA